MSDNDIQKNTEDRTSPDYRVFEEDRSDVHSENNKDANVANRHDPEETVHEDQVFLPSEESVNVPKEKAAIYKEYEKLTEDPNRRDDDSK